MVVPKTRLNHSQTYSIQALVCGWLMDGVRVKAIREPKKKSGARLAEWPWRNRKILRRCMSRSPYKPQAHSEWTGSPCYGVFPRPKSPGP
ncbi:unnamed protein product [Mycena citricolor]|uniref:Uncharacterized protein n=1 Tax=Mycena citricolor TaxID=2018698 RepID=A0AAD2JX23_9AGAR|nr:unnamed protein product [Mycena citricolor]